MSATGAAPATRAAWRVILEYFEPAYQLGMTATPLRDDNRDTYLYFGNPIYQYSLRQGIEDGFLAPYRVHRVITEWDAAGWRPSKDELDRYGRAIPDDEYQTKDFERVVALRARTEAIARHLTEFLKKTDRFAKTIVFCVDQEHAERDARALCEPQQRSGRSSIPDYVCRVTADEGDIGRGHLSRFQDVETKTPDILTTSQLLTTGVDAPTCKNIVLARVVGSMTEFKQIIGRGTRVRDDYGKLWFNIIDYTGSATRLFADPDFDGDPARSPRRRLKENGETTSHHRDAHRGGAGDAPGPTIMEPPTEERRKFYFDGGQVEIAAHLVYELDPNGKQLRVVRYTDYAAETVRTLCPTAPNSVRSGPTRAAIRRLSADWPSAASTSRSLPRQRSSPMPIRSTCSATSPSTPRCAPAASARSTLKRDPQGFLRTVRPEGASDPRRAARKIRGAWRRAVRAAGRAQGAADFRPWASWRNHQPLRRRRSASPGRDRTARHLMPPKTKTAPAARAHHCAIPRQPAQVRARHHAEGQGAERRP